MSNVIQKLDDVVVDQIKAGEVIERPVAVVKECVENALDAGSNQITVELIDGGKKLIRITDNGFGMLPEDLQMCLERHATSKLKSLDDLLSISSFGFRGEALPSIASVSQFSITSKTSNMPMAKICEVQFGEKKKIADNPSFNRVGTQVVIRDIFEKIPVRLKFLKSTATEFSHIYDLVTNLALAYPRVQFSLIHNGKEIFAKKSCESALQRAQEMMKDSGVKCASVDFQQGSFSVKGLVGLPEHGGAQAKPSIAFVNGRWIKDKIVRTAIHQAGIGLVMKGETLPSILFITCDPKFVDVNVHPAKTEVRFMDAGYVIEKTSIAIREAIKSHVKEVFEKPLIKPVSSFSSSVFSPMRPEPRFPISNAPSARRFESSYSMPTQRTYSEPLVRTPSAPSLLREPEVVSEKYNFDEAQYLGQFLKCYLIFERDREMLIVDQHAIHERILFEEFIQQGIGQVVPKQGLLIPTEKSLSVLETSLVAEYHKEIEALGFTFDLDEANNTVSLEEVPQILKPENIEKAFAEILERLNAQENKEISDHVAKGITPEKVYHLLYATLACHSAVRAGEELSSELVRRLIKRSKDVDFFLHCPHGRPVYRRFSEREVQGWFQRT